MRIVFVSLLCVSSQAQGKTFFYDAAVESSARSSGLSVGSIAAEGEVGRGLLLNPSNPLPSSIGIAAQYEHSPTNAKIEFASGDTREITIAENNSELKALGSVPLTKLRGAYSATGIVFSISQNRQEGRIDGLSDEFTSSTASTRYLVGGSL